jgi:hypothetical protein
MAYSHEQIWKKNRSPAAWILPTFKALAYWFPERPWVLQCSPMTSSSPSSSQMTMRSSSLVMSSLVARWEREARVGSSGGRPLAAKVPPSPGAVKGPGVPYWVEGFEPEYDVGPDTICRTGSREDQLNLMPWATLPTQPPGDPHPKPESVLVVPGCLLPHHPGCVHRCEKRLGAGQSQAPQLCVAVLLHRDHSLESWCQSSRVSGLQRTGAQTTL